MDLLIVGAVVLGYLLGRVSRRLPEGVHITSKRLATDPVFVEELSEAIKRAARRKGRRL